MKRLIVVAAIIIALITAVVFASYATSNYNEQGGARTVIGGSLDVVSGGDLDVESGGAIKIAGTAVTATAAEINKVAGVTAGTATASKAAVLGTNSELDNLRLDGSLYLFPRDTSSIRTEGYLYWSDANNCPVYWSGAALVALSAGTGDNTLDNAYDQGTPGAGRSIDVDTGAVALTVSDTDDNSALTVTQNDATNDPNAVEIDMASGSTGIALSIDGQSAGTDIKGTAGAFSVSGAGALIAASIDVADGNIVLQSDMILDQSADNAWSWTENGEDIVWTFSNDTITLSSTLGVVSIDWGALAPTFGSAIVASSGMTSSDDITLANGKALKSSTTSAQTAKIQVYDNDTGPGYKDAITLTNGNTPAMSLGGNAMTVAIDSSDWDVSASGAMTGIGAITSNGLFTGSLGATISGATVNLNATSNFAVNIGTGTTTGAIAIGGTGTQTLNIGNGAGAKAVNVGSNNSTSATTILSGTGNLTINNNAGAATSGLGTGTTTGTVTIGGAGTQTIAVGDGAAAKTVSLGSSNSTSTTTILSGSGTLLLNNDNNQNTLIGTGTTTGSVTIGGAGTQTIAVGDGAAAKTVSLGSSNSTSTTTILSGSGTVLINKDNNQATNINTGTSTGTVTIGGAAAQSIDIGNGAAAKTVTLGSSNTTSTTNINAGSGNINITGSVVRTSQQYVQTIAYCKVGSTGGWVVPAASDAAHLATLPQSQTASTLIIPITIPLKVGYTITAWTINGQIDSAGNAATLDGKLYKHTEATAGFANAAIGSGMAQLSKIADYKVVEGEASLSEVIAADESYYLLVTGTTAATTDIEIASITVTVSEI